jgi:CHAT domain-containing protein
LERYAFGVLDSGRHLLDLAQAAVPSGRASFLAVGDVNYARAEDLPTRTGSNGRERTPEFRSPLIDKTSRLTFEPLPGTRDEVFAVRDLFNQLGGSEALCLRGSEATAQRVRSALPGKRYLHLATHGYFASGDLRSLLSPDGPASAFGEMSPEEVFEAYPGLLCGLVWSGANAPPRRPGIEESDFVSVIMTAEQVAGLDLSSCELAVLSACETAVGVVTGEGIRGLQKAFHQAGARGVVASLWKVPDGATRELMICFYRNVWAHNLPKLEALRQAQLALLTQDAAGRPVGKGLLLRPARAVRRVPPWVWAAWTFSGDWR